MRFAGDPGPTDWNFGGSSAAATTTMAPTPTPTSLPVSTSASPVTSMTSSASASSTTSASTQSGLRPAQKAGLGLGVSLGILLSCLLCFLFIRYRRRQTNSNRGVMEQTDPIPKTDIKPPTTSTNPHVSGRRLCSRIYPPKTTMRMVIRNRCRG